LFGGFVQAPARVLPVGVNRGQIHRSFIDHQWCLAREAYPRHRAFVVYSRNRKERPCPAPQPARPRLSVVHSPVARSPSPTHPVSLARLHIPRSIYIGLAARTQLVWARRFQGKAEWGVVCNSGYGPQLLMWFFCRGTRLRSARSRPRKLEFAGIDTVDRCGTLLSNVRVLRSHAVSTQRFSAGRFGNIIRVKILTTFSSRNFCGAKAGLFVGVTEIHTRYPGVFHDERQSDRSDTCAFRAQAVPVVPSFARALQPFPGASWLRPRTCADCDSSPRSKRSVSSDACWPTQLSTFISGLLVGILLLSAPCLWPKTVARASRAFFGSTRSCTEIT